MPSIRPTRTIGPLHLEDVEPHRFEDLVRQLLYDFRDWKRLEATGRARFGDGFDVRGLEAASGAVRDDEEEDEDRDASPLLGERVWLIQCKREKAIAARKIAAYMDALEPALREGVYGIIFAAACDFSRATRDAFFAKARELGLSEGASLGEG
jgi:Restriction endonuclease